MNQDSNEDTILLVRAQFAVERKQRQRMVLLALPGILGLLCYIASSAFSDDRILSILLNLTALAMIALFALFAVYIYLQTGFKFSKEKDFAFELERLSSEATTVEKNSSLASEITFLRDEIEKLKHSLPGMDDQSRAETLQALRANLMEHASSDLANEFYTKITQKVAADAKNNKVNDVFDMSRRRLLMELDALGRRGNLNLGIGAVVTLIGLLLLGMTVFYEVSDVKDLIGMASHYLPRLSLIVLIEIFAYFFLSLYKAGLSEIKYFQNELTNIETRQVALQAALDSNENSIISSVVTKLSETERNYILSKDQTTIELEKAKLESESKVAFGKFVSDFFQKVKPSS